MCIQSRSKYVYGHAFFDEFAGHSLHILLDRRGAGGERGNDPVVDRGPHFQVKYQIAILFAAQERVLNCCFHHMTRSCGGDDALDRGRLN